MTKAHAAASAPTREPDKADRKAGLGTVSPPAAPHARAQAARGAHGVGLDSPEEVLLRLATGYRMTQALYVAAKLGVADRLASGSASAEALARELHVDPDRLFRVLRALVSIGVLTLDASKRFGLTPVGELLRSDVPGSMATTVIFQAEQPYPVFADLLHTVRTGETGFDHRYGIGLFDYLAQHPDASEVFNRAMTSSFLALRDPFPGYSLTGRKVILDIGGGRGHLLAAVLRANPTLRGILFDLPAAVVEAPAVLSAAGVADRCQIRTGSAFEAIPRGAEVYVMTRLLHGMTDESALTLLTNCRRVVPEGGVLLLREAVLPEVNVPPARASMDLVMMVMNGGRERTEAEWRSLLKRGGFSLQRVVPSEYAQDLIEAVPD